MMEILKFLFAFIVLVAGIALLGFLGLGVLYSICSIFCWILNGGGGSHYRKEREEQERIQRRLAEQYHRQTHG